MKLPTEAQMATFGKLAELGRPDGELALRGVKSLLMSLLMILFGAGLLVGGLVGLTTGEWAVAIAGTFIGGLIAYGGVAWFLESVRGRRHLYLFEHGLVAVDPSGNLIVFNWRIIHVHKKVSRVVSHSLARDGYDFQEEYTLTRPDGATLKLDTDMGNKKAVMALGRRIAAAANFEQGR